MKGFCFSTKGKEAQVLKPVDGDDFVFYLNLWARQEGVTHIAMTLEDRNALSWGVRDMMNDGLRVIVVDPAYSPIGDALVLPLLVHRNVGTLGKVYPDCGVIGRLIGEYVDGRNLESVKVHFQDGEPLYDMPLDRSGWVVTSSAGNDQELKSRLYTYRVERDYELETKNERRKSSTTRRN